MGEEIKVVVQYIVYPLVSSLVGVIVVLYVRDLKSTKKEISLEKEEREKETKHNDTNIEKIFDLLNEINEKIGDIKGRILTQEKICAIRHKGKKD